jgi:hypothetical protein
MQNEQDEQSGARLGILVVSLKILPALLHLPDDVKFIRVRQTGEQEQQGTFEILVEAPNLDIVSESQMLPLIKCTIHKEFCDMEERSHIVSGEVSN